MAEISIAILGLGRLGTSIGLALKRYNAKSDRAHKFTITGYSSIAPQVKSAQKLNAVDDIARHPIDAVRGRDIIVLAMPYSDVEGAYSYIAPDVRPGAVVIDFSPLKQPSLKWAEKHLSKDAHMLGMTALLNGKYLFDGVDETERATADLFDGGMMLLMPGVRCIPEAIDLGRDFATILGATMTQFIDPAENDTLVSLTENLPALIGLAYYYMLEKNEGWGDIQKQINPAAGMLTHHLYDTHPDDLRDLWTANRETLLRHTDDLIATLRNLRRVLAENDRNSVEEVTSSSAASYEAWYNRRLKNRWSNETQAPVETPDVMSSLFGSWVGNRMRRKDKSDDKNS
jgi:prephenate dehydrogenase